MARGDSAPDTDAPYSGLVRCGENAAFQVLDSTKRGLPPYPHSLSLNLNLNLEATRNSGSSVRTRGQDAPESIRNYVGLSEARALLDASARDGKSVKIVVLNDKGQVEQQVFVNCSRPHATTIQQPPIEAAMSQFHEVKVFESFDRQQKSSEQSSADSSRGTSMSTPSSAPSGLQMIGEGELADVSPRRKRGASVPPSGSATPAEEEEDGPIMTNKVTKQFSLGDSAGIERFYERSFSAAQQTAMKSITKSWIKEIEPDKQKKYPYSHDKKPPWWPEGCYYREPDHLKKPDRQVLAVAILRFVIQDQQRFEGRGIDRLERVTFEKANIEFDKESDEKIKQRKEILKQVFRIARAEQMLVADERDASDRITVWEFEDPSPNKPRKRQRKKPASKKQTQNSDTTQRVDQIREHLSPTPEAGVNMKPDLSIDVCDNSDNTLNESIQGSQPASAIVSQGSNIWAHSPNVSQQHYFAIAQSCPVRTVEMHQQEQALEYDDSHSRYSSFDGSAMDIDSQIATSSPAMMRQAMANVSFDSTPSLQDQIHWSYPEMNMHIAQMQIEQPHGLPLRTHQHPPIQQQTPLVYTAAWDQRKWEATPGASYHQPMQPGDYGSSLN